MSDLAGFGRPYPAARSQDWFTFFAIIAFPILILDFRLPIPSLKVRVSDFYIIGLFIYFICFKPGAIRWTIVCLQWFLPFLIYLGVSALLRRQMGGVIELIQWCLILIWIPLFSYVFRRDPDRALTLLLSGFAVAAIGVAAYHISIGFIFSYKQLGDARFAFGLFALTSLTVTFSRKTPSLWLLVGLAMVLLILSDERKGIVMSMLSIVMAAPLIALNRYGSFAGPAALLIFGLSMVSGFLFYYFGVRGSVDLIYFLDEEFARWDSNTHRANLLANGVEIFTSHPWFGVGAKALGYHMEEFYINEGLAIYTHNWYLDMFVEYGVVGVLLYSLPVFMALRYIASSGKSLTALYPLLLYCVMVPVFMHNGTTTTFIVVTCLGIGHVLREGNRNG